MMDWEKSKPVKTLSLVVATLFLSPTLGLAEPHMTYEEVLQRRPELQANQAQANSHPNQAIFAQQSTMPGNPLSRPIRPRGMVVSETRQPWEDLQEQNNELIENIEELDEQIEATLAEIDEVLESEDIVNKLQGVSDQLRDEETQDLSTDELIDFFEQNPSQSSDLIDGLIESQQALEKAQEQLDELYENVLQDQKRIEEAINGEVSDGDYYRTVESSVVDNFNRFTEIRESVEEHIEKADTYMRRYYEKLKKYLRRLSALIDKLLKQYSDSDVSKIDLLQGMQQSIKAILENLDNFKSPKTFPSMRSLSIL